jgi:hypothetical protein
MWPQDFLYLFSFSMARLFSFRCQTAALNLAVPISYLKKVSLKLVSFFFVNAVWGFRTMLVIQSWQTRHSVGLCLSWTLELEDNAGNGSEACWFLLWK